MKEVNWDLVVNNLQLCGAIACRMPRPPSVTIEDLVFGPGMDALIRASRAWDPTRGIKFTSYAFSGIRKSMFRFVQQSMRRMHVSIDVAPDIEVNEQNDKVDAYNILRRLDKLDQFVLLLRFWKGLTTNEIADTLGCSKMTAVNYLNESLQRCRDLLNASLE